MIAGVYKPTAGEIYFEDRALSSLRTRRQRLAYSGDVAMVFQDPYSSINPAYRGTHPIERGIVLHRSEVARRRGGGGGGGALKSVGLVPGGGGGEEPDALVGGQRAAGGG